MPLPSLDRDPAASSARTNMHDGDHFVAGVNPLLRVVRQHLTPHVEPVTEVRANASQASVDAAVDGVVELYLRVIKRERPFVVVAHERLPSPAHDLHVLLRHRLLRQVGGCACLRWPEVDAPLHNPAGLHLDDPAGGLLDRHTVASPVTADAACQDAYSESPAASRASL